MNKENKEQTINIFGETIPLTKKGLPDLRRLTKQQREYLRGFLEEEKKKDKELEIQELERFFKEKYVKPSKK